MWVRGAPVVCPRCGFPHNVSACPNCGYPSPLIPVYQYPPRRAQSGVLSLAWDVSMILVMVLLLINLAVLIYVSYAAVLPELTAGSLPKWPIYTIMPSLRPIFFFEGPVQVTIYFFFILVVLLLAYAHFALSDGKSLVRLLTSPLPNLMPRLRSRNRWTMVAQLFLATTFFQVAYILALNAVGIDTPAPPREMPDVWYDMFGLANASVYEEIASRIALIGLPLFIGSLILRLLKTRGGSSTVMEYRDRRRFMLGSFRYLIGGNVSRKSPARVLVPALGLLLFSSLMFGLAHASGWGDWKVFPAFVAGLALGYVFLRGGFLAAVTLHFATDYMAATIILIGEDIALQMFFSLFIIVLLIFGAGYFLYYIIYASNLVRERFLAAGPAAAPAGIGRGESWGQEVQAAPPQAKWPPGPNQGGFFATACPNCGWPEAAYAEGRLRCTRCGKER